MPHPKPKPAIKELRIQANPEQVADAVLKGGAPRKPEK